MNAPRSHLAEVIGDALPLPPPTPPRPPTLIGPDKWWNPLSPSWPPTALGRSAIDLAREKSAKAAEELERKLEQKAAEVQAGMPAIDPIIVAETIVGRPTWGYYFPTVAAGLGSAVVLLGAGALVYRAKKKRR